MTVKKILPRCAAVTRDGSPCGRRVKDGSNPPLCHLHKPGATVPNTFQPAERSPLEIIQKLMHDSDPAIRLRAVDMFSRYEERKGCATCAAREELSLKHDNLFGRATHAQLTELSELLARWKALTAIVARQAIQPHHLNPDVPPPHVIERWREEDAAEKSRAEREHHRTARPAAQVPVAPTEHERTAPDDSEQVAPYQLPRDLWESVGLFEQNDVVTHPLGDDYAAKILSGEIPLEQAQAEQAETTAHIKRMGGSTANITKLTW